MVRIENVVREWITVIYYRSLQDNNSKLKKSQIYILKTYWHNLNKVITEELLTTGLNTITYWGETQTRKYQNFFKSAQHKGVFGLMVIGNVSIFTVN